MIDVFMTPQSDEELFEEGMSPEEVQLSPPAAEKDSAGDFKEDSPPVSTFVADQDKEEGVAGLTTPTEPAISTFLEKEDVALDEAAKSGAVTDAPTKNNRNEVEEEKKGEAEDAQASSAAASEQSEPGVEEAAADSKVEVYSDTQ
mmetsp:Transcript_21998/g.29390  ORF Transcript_21998/g.29390 Transcript_21998/m.29390 type:complete len:145 (-) Transcript_21998:1925-2359(-)